jgi:hypothetical protein
LVGQCWQCEPDSVSILWWTEALGIYPTTEGWMSSIVLGHIKIN